MVKPVKPPLSNPKQNAYKEHRLENGPTDPKGKPLNNGNQPKDPNNQNEGAIQQYQNNAQIPSQLAPLDFEKIKLDSFILIIG